MKKSTPSSKPVSANPNGLSNTLLSTASRSSKIWSNFVSIILKSISIFPVSVFYDSDDGYGHASLTVAFMTPPVRIPKTDKNKDGTKPCKLCSEGKIRRKTTWMCATCEVPLCTRPLMGEEPETEGGGVLTHHARWHAARDLVAEHMKVHGLLKEGRESRKRSRDSMSGMEHHEMHHVDHMGHDLGVDHMKVENDEVV